MSVAFRVRYFPTLHTQIPFWHKTKATDLQVLCGRNRILHLHPKPLGKDSFLSGFFIHATRQTIFKFCRDVTETFR